MIDYHRYIEELQGSGISAVPCYQLHIQELGYFPEILHKHYTKNFYDAMRLRSIRRMRPTYIRLVNIRERRNALHQGTSYHYISDIVSPSLALLANICPVNRSVDVSTDRKKTLSPRQIQSCFDRPVEIETIGPYTQRIITRIDPLILVNNILRAYPKIITSFDFGLNHTLYTNVEIDNENYFTQDPMPFRYKRVTRHQPITFNLNKF